MAVRNAEHGVVRGHSRSSAMSPFDRAHTTSYSTLIETMRLSSPRQVDRVVNNTGYCRRRQSSLLTTPIDSHES